MEEITLANVMNTYRERFGLMQQDVCDGICAASTYLHAELKLPDVEFVYQEPLLARVGQDTAFFECALDEEAYAVWAERAAIRAAMAGRKYKEVELRIRNYREMYSEQHILHEQFCLYYEMKLAWCRGESENVVCELAREALSITKEAKNMPHIKRNLYTPMEMDLLLTLVQYRYGDWGDFKRRKNCLLKMLEYISAYYSRKIREEIETRAWLELLTLEEQHGEPQQLLEYIEKAISCLNGSANLLPVADLRFRKARVLHTIAAYAENREELEKQCREECNIAYDIFEVLACMEKCDEVKRFCEEEFQWHITTPTK